MNVAELVVRYLEDINVKHIFFIPGGPLIPMTEAIWGSNKIKFVYTSHECGAAFMAYGDRLLNSSLGVCCLTTGPGATNAITGVATAKIERIPMVVITAMNATKHFAKGPAQDSTAEGMDTVGIYEKFTFYSRMIHHPGEASYVIQNAIKIAMLKRGPVHISIPTDVGFAEVPQDCLVTLPHQYIPSISGLPEEKQLLKATKVLAQAQRPLLFVGHGAILSRAFEHIKVLAERLSIPVMTTMKGKGAFPEDHPLALGVYGLAGSFHTNYYLEKKHDVLLTLGVGFHELDTDNWAQTIMPSKALIQVDINPLMYGCNYPGEISLIGDVSKTLGKINHLLDEQLISSNATANRSQEIAKLKNEVIRFSEPEKMYSQTVPLKPQRLLRDLQKSFPEDTIYVVDIGGAFMWATHFLTLKTPYTFLTSSRSAPMGFSIAAIGCRCANSKRPIVAIIGDGALKMHGMEIATAVNNDLPIIFVVLNDSQWGLVKFGDQLLGLKAQVADFAPVDCAKIAEALGAKGIKITQPGEISPQLATQLLATKETVVLDVYIDPSECPPFGSRIHNLGTQMKGTEDVEKIVDEDIAAKQI